jgi:APA family basic amino acid/polyamine antiporter
VENNKSTISLTGAVAVIAACMIGTGVFTSLGYQVLGIKSVFAIIVLWATGGLAALCGALVYAELAVRYPGSGGEYNYLSRIYHPALGFLSGWTSATIGFAAPIAAAAMAFGTYFGYIFPEINATITAVIVVLVAALINFAGISLSEIIQKGTTYLNLLLIIVLIFCGITMTQNIDHFSFTMGAADWKAIASNSFAVSLIYVSFAYSGWNAVTYVAGEVKNPNRTVPRSLIISVILVTVLYILLNFVFLFAVPMEELAQKFDDKGNPVGPIVAATAAEAIFGVLGSKIISGLICLALLSSVLGMTIAGPRVTDKIGQDMPALKFLSFRNKSGAPIIAILLQVAISITLALTAAFDVVIRYVGFSLALFTTLTVAGILVVRWVKKEPIAAGLYKTPLFPVPAIIFILLEIWMLTFTMIDHPIESLAGLGTVLTGLLVFYFFNNSKNSAKI